MISLANGICCIGVVIRAPEQAGARRGLRPVMQITDLRERYGPQGRGYSAPSPKARSGSGTISSRALSHAPPATFHFRPDGGQRFALKNRCLPARYENRYLLLGDKSPPAVRRGRQSSERRLSQARSDRKDNADNSRS